MNQPAGAKGEVRPILKSLLLSVVTCGLYAWWWTFEMAGEINTYLGYTRISVIKIWLLVACTCGLYGLYWMFVDGKNAIKEVQAKAGLPEDPPLIADVIRMQAALNRIWEQIPG